MTRFNSRIAAIVLGVLAVAYMVGSLATGRRARAEAPIDLSAGAAEAGLDLWKAVALLCEDHTLVVDARPADDFGRYHLPGSKSEPGVSPARLRELSGQGAVVVVAAKDVDAQRLVGEARGDRKDARIFHLVDGVRSWYLAFDLPVPLFAEAPPPRGYPESLAAVKDFIARRDPAARQAALEAVQTLARVNYQPTLLRSAGKARAGGGAKKKISGGCG